MPLERIARMLHRRPPQGRFREQLFWLVDLVFACKASGDPALAVQASLVEQALASLSAFIETGDASALGNATRQVEQFARSVMAAVAATPGGKV